jgi:hypothetical protein
MCVVRLPPDSDYRHGLRHVCAQRSKSRHSSQINLLPAASFLHRFLQLLIESVNLYPMKLSIILFLGLASTRPVPAPQAQNSVHPVEKDLVVAASILLGAAVVLPTLAYAGNKVASAMTRTAASKATINGAKTVSEAIQLSINKLT